MKLKTKNEFLKTLNKATELNKNGEYYKAYEMITERFESDAEMNMHYRIATIEIIKPCDIEHIMKWDLKDINKLTKILEMRTNENEPIYACNLRDEIRNITEHDIDKVISLLTYGINEMYTKNKNKAKPNKNDLWTIWY